MTDNLDLVALALFLLIWGLAMYFVVTDRGSYEL